LFRRREATKRRTTKSQSFQSDGTNIRQAGEIAPGSDQKRTDDRKIRVFGFDSRAQCALATKSCGAAGFAGEPL
jgi:hypothetical protein